MNKKGFTLIELLAVLTILGVIVTIATVGFSSFVGKSNETYYKTLENTTRDAVIDFFSDNRNFLPKEAGAKREINLQDLITNKYLEDLVDAKNLPCSGTAVVVKKQANDYDYKICITCPSRTEKIGDGCA